MTKFYTNVARHKNTILVRGINDGTPFKESVRYKPYLFIPTNKSSEYTNLEGNAVGKIGFDTMSDARQWVQENEDVANRVIYGLTDWVYLYIYFFYFLIEVHCDAFFNTPFFENLVAF